MLNVKEMSGYPLLAPRTVMVCPSTPPVTGTPSDVTPLKVWLSTS
jgi:hypothetical protein